MAKLYDQEGADELVFLDISASHEGRKTMVDVVEQVAAKLAIPFTVGGGINQLSDMKTILRAGADKVSVNTAAVLRPELITEGAEFFGSQCIVLAIDAKYDQNLAHIKSTRTAAERKQIGKSQHGQKKASNAAQEKYC